MRWHRDRRMRWREPGRNSGGESLGEFSCVIGVRSVAGRATWSKRQIVPIPRHILRLLRKSTDGAEEELRMARMKIFFLGIPSVSSVKSVVKYPPDPRARSWQSIGTQASQPVRIEGILARRDQACGQDAHLPHSQNGCVPTPRRLPVHPLSMHEDAVEWSTALARCRAGLPVFRRKAMRWQRDLSEPL